MSVRPVSEDAFWLSRALSLAENGLYTAAPNPRVGCVIVRGGRVVGEGWHQKTGGAHAEAAAMRSCGDLRDAEVFVSLEPCAHVGETPSCAAALARAKPARVVAAMPDPNPQVAGRGMRMLRDAGIAAEFAPAAGEMFRRALDLNLGFVSRMIRGRPWLRLKIAATLDGKTALSSGLSRWISGEESRLDAHRLRARSCAILAGIGTALADNPRLTVRGVSSPRRPLRVLVDRDLRAPPDLKMFAEDGAIVATAARDKIFAGNAEVLRLPGADGRVDLAALLRELAARGVNEATVEAGRRLCGAFVAADLADEIVLYQAPKLFGGGMAMIETAPPQTPDAAMKFFVKQCGRSGDDIKIVYENPRSRSVLADAAARAIV